MNEYNQESLSALLDGEANELEVRRLLSSAVDEQSLNDRWQRYQAVSAIIQDEPLESLDLLAAIHRGIDGEEGGESEVFELESEQPRPQRSWWSSLAVAASVAGAVLLTIQSLSPTDDVISTEVNSLASGTYSPGANASGVDVPKIDTLGANVANAEIALAVTEEGALSDGQQQLRDYVLQQPDNMSRNTRREMMPFARIVNFSQDQESAVRALTQDKAE